MTDPTASSLAQAGPSDGRRLGRIFLFVFVPLMALFLSSARTDLPYHIDAATNVFTAWTIGTTGSPVLGAYEELAAPSFKGVFAWIVPSERGPVSQYPPGAALLAAPLYTVWPDAQNVLLVADNAEESVQVTVPIPDLRPVAFVASATTAAALGLLALTALELGMSARAAVTTGLVGGLATSAWTVAADQFWQHGPNMFWVALGMWLAVRGRWGWAGAAFGALAITRPPVVLIGAALGVLLLAQRDVRSAIRLAAGVTPGVVALLAYNAWLLGSPSVSGAYGGEFASRATEVEPVRYLSNVGSAFFDPLYGLFVWSPFVALLVLAVITMVRKVPPWAVASALGGLAYLLLQLKLNRASGGAGFSYYRYPLETLVATGPILALAGREAWKTGTLWRAALVGTTAFSIIVHAMAAW
ncbi:MAG TPA: hypothetical protein VM848_05350 [Acidimicrobiia bacterium]|nr:hypothetical protein [Acidimicrobiia bacterium]